MGQRKPGLRRRDEAVLLALELRDGGLEAGIANWKADEEAGRPHVLADLATVLEQNHVSAPTPAEIRAARMILDADANSN